MTIDPVREYWDGSVLHVEWTIVDVDGQPVTGVTVAGTVALPGGGTAAMGTSVDGNVCTATYQVTAPGRHGWRLEASGTATDAREGSFVVRRSEVGLPPITVDPTTDIGRVRLLCTDLDEVEPLFDDASISAFLSMENGRVKRAAALALETMASSEAIVSKAIRTLDLQTDGPKVASELRQRAKSLRDQDAEQGDDTGGAWGLEIVDYDQWAAYRTGL